MKDAADVSGKVSHVLFWRALYLGRPGTIRAPLDVLRHHVTHARAPAHAPLQSRAQGEGELNGNALETSLDVDFTVELIRNQPLSGPRVESPAQVMTVGLGGSLEDALRRAVAQMGEYLEQEYGLTPSELAQVMGSAIELSINEVADRNAGVVARISKQRPATLPRKHAPR
jgi:hypothetical protein